MKKKSFIIATALVLACTFAIIGSFAWFTFKSSPVVNTFKAADGISGSLDETTDPDSYVIVPGATIAKDPTITITKGSPACYVYALVENELSAIATTDMDMAKWTLIAGDAAKGLYKYNTTLAATDADATAAVFANVTIDNSIDTATVASFNGKTITVTGYAHQATGVDAATADAAALAEFGF